jgi:hypothetical protein
MNLGFEVLTKHIIGTTQPTPVFARIGQMRSEMLR